ncbi:MAG: hypothetical protein V4650_06235 [Pseudomonadota bacterium]
MRRRLPWLPLVAMALISCRGTAPVETVPAPAPAAGMATTQGAATQGNVRTQPLTLGNELLPSMTVSATVKAESPLLQRPKAGSVILKTLAAGDTVQLLGSLDNADGQWVSVASGDSQGWLRAGQVTP